MTEQTEYLKSKQYEEDESFWREKFSSLPPEASLLFPPFDEHYNGDNGDAVHRVLQISSRELACIKDKVDHMGLKLFDYFLTCLLIILQRYLGMEEVMVAIPVCSSQCVLFRNGVDVEKPFQNYAAATSTSWKDFLLHGNYPFSHVEDLVFAMHGTEVQYFCVAELDYQSETDQSKFTTSGKQNRMPLHIQIRNDCNDGGISVDLEYHKGFVLDNVAERFLRSYVNLCNKASLDSNIRDIDYLADEEKTLLKEFGFTKNVESIGKPIHSSFEDAVLHAPTETAVIYEDVILSYRELNEMASSLAHHISEVISSSDIRTKPIVLFMNKDHLAVASILSVWKVGGFFLPLSTTHTSTLKDLIQSSSSSLFLHNVEFPEDIGQLVLSKRLNVLDVRSLASVKRSRYEKSYIDTSTNFTDADITYAIRTSGSTGKPKTCKISHKSLGILSQAWVDACGLFPGARILHWAPLSFDVSVGELVRALISTQGTLVLCPDKRRLDIEYIHHLFERFRITHVEFTPQFALRVAEAARPLTLHSLKCLVIGSDVTNQKLFQTIKSKLRPDQRFIHGYGMTEATIDSIYYDSELIPRTRSGTVPIGKPLAGVGAMILDALTKLPCPIGTKGELYLFGDIIAGGDVKTENIRFIDSSFEALPTKDQCCWLPSGDIEIYGRLDDVVKIRGFRVSLAEVENKIRDFVDGVQDVCVLNLHDETGENGKSYLVAFLVVKEDINENVDKKRVSFCLSGRVPYYMIPDFVTCIPDIPLTTNGKVNRKSLPSLKEIIHNHRFANDASENTTPSNSDENLCSLLQELFAEALGLGGNVNVSLTETFMNQGGHSLVLVAFHNLVSQRISFDVSIETIFKHPTIVSLDAFIRHHKSKELL